VRRSTLPGRARLALVIGFVVLGLSHSASVVTPARAQAPGQTPIPNSSVSMTAEAMLGGSFTPGSWAAVRVNVGNDGPTIEGELRLRNRNPNASTFAVALQLATGARQEHILYGQTGVFGSRYVVELVSGAQTLASVDVAFQGRQTDALGAYVIAERPQALVGLLQGVDPPGSSQIAVVQTTAEDLPPRAEAWSSVDMLIWQDIDSGRLDTPRLEALRTWIAVGGRLVIVAGSTGATTLGGFPPELLPYQPTGVTDVSTTDLAALMGQLPADATSVPALSGQLERGVAIGQRGGSVIAARSSFGRGSVTLIGIDPATQWMLNSTTDDAFWASATGATQLSRGPVASNDDFLSFAISNLPSVRLPPMGELLILIVAYIVAIGPLNYLILRRRDRREWGWLTMPVTVVVFAIGAYVFGTTVKGSDIIVNELAVVRGATGSDRGRGDVVVGVYSPTRSSFDVRIGGGALVSSLAQSDFGETTTQQPVNVLLGDPTVVRNFGVGFGSLRAFRAESSMPTPVVNSDLRMVDGHVQGTITNAGPDVLEDVSVVFGQGFVLVGTLVPGQVASVDVALAAETDFTSLGDRMFPFNFNDDPNAARRDTARRALVTHLAGGFNEFGNTSLGILSAGPHVLVWQSGSTLDIGVGSGADHVGERVYVLSAVATVFGETSFTGAAMQAVVQDLDADDGGSDVGSYYLTHGTMTLEFKPVPFGGRFTPSGLTVRFASAGSVRPAASGDELAPLPESDQPSSDAPLSTDPRPGQSPSLPRMQIFDRATEEWVEYEPMTGQRTYEISDPARFVDEAGAVRVRFVARDESEFVQFAFGLRLAGNVQ
jgi:hypothetical protein